MKSSYHTPHNNFPSYLLLLFTCFIVIFVTKNLFSQLQISLDEKSTAAAELQEKEERLSELNILQSRLANNENEELQSIEYLGIEFKESDILEYLHDYASTVNKGEERFVIRDISLRSDMQSEIGFKMAQVRVSVISSSESTLFNFMQYLTSSDQKYKFYIDSFQYPMTQGSANIQVNIPLSIYYK